MSNLKELKAVAKSINSIFPEEPKILVEVEDNTYLKYHAEIDFTDSNIIVRVDSKIDKVIKAQKDQLFLCAEDTLTGIISDLHFEAYSRYHYKLIFCNDEITNHVIVLVDKLERMGIKAELRDLEVPYKVSRAKGVIAKVSLSYTITQHALEKLVELIQEDVR